ncbi:3-hydroxyisobutyrate dehydrogenase-like beta-hydroxyacid dehydrogenase [Arthrobacter pigmenti]|uniref:3-hydroxyisobutyrate dehydrogenase-like beta-hydroxyacid dehydrogenase n=1 Tax=Arthrobacter pigmenti TaxID=271432 RepID=A0A846RMW9_9MICC|nr:3-hydroxyisobutyrate dehydrogenase-like beta-hydroxyacid dehydrogenase [Arthrobacter pigmenti]
MTANSPSALSATTTPDTQNGVPGVVVGVIGLGNLGLPIARRLLATGIDVLGFDVSPEACQAARGLSLASSIRDLSERADIVLVLVSDADQCRSAISGTSGVVSATTLPTAVVIMSTVGPDALTDLAAPILGLGTAVIDAPVSGGAEAAAKGELSLMVGGASEYIERCSSVLSTLGTMHIMGELGAGQSAKLANQMVFFGTYAVLQEALALAKSDGVDSDALLGALSGGTADSWAVRHPRFLQETARAYDAAAIGPSHRSWHKDLRTAVQAASARDLDTPVTILVSQVVGDRVDRSARR